MGARLQFDYTAVGHVTVDVLQDGSRRAGGSAFYSALQAARLGRRALIITAGVTEEIERLIAPHRDELSLIVVPAAETTTLLTQGSGSSRRQRLLAWAGPLPADLRVDTEILHLAPVARETPSHWSGSARFVGLTPQGLVRESASPEGWVSLAEGPDGAGSEAAALAGRCDAVVLSALEQDNAATLVLAALSGGAVVAVTDGRRPTTLQRAGEAPIELVVPPLQQQRRDDLGAGDVFAAAFFTELAEGASPGQAARFANAACAVRIAGVGVAAIGDRQAIAERLRTA